MTNSGWAEPATIGAIFQGIALVIAAIGALYAKHAGTQATDAGIKADDAKTHAVAASVAAAETTTQLVKANEKLEHVDRNTNSGLTEVKGQVLDLGTKLEAARLARTMEAEKSRDIALARVKDLEAQVVKYAEAAMPSASPPASPEASTR